MSHLLYVNDMLKCRADEMEASSINKILFKYSNWSGQQANMDKSQVFFSKITSRNVKRTFKEVLGFKEVKTKNVYLKRT